MSESELLKVRREKIESLKADGVALYPNDVEVTATTQDIIIRFGELDRQGGVYQYPGPEGKNPGVHKKKYCRRRRFFTVSEA
jgi:hypothetical protein